VASIIAEIVAPAGECSIAKTRDCFVAESGLFGFATLLLPGAFVAELCGPDPADFAALAALPAASGFVAEAGRWGRNGADFFVNFPSSTLDCATALAVHDGHMSPSTHFSLRVSHDSRSG
jgi:hypothetical protein